MFAPAHHQATRFVVPVRARAGGADDLQPARAADQPGGRAAPAGRRLRRRASWRRSAGALARLGVDRALVVSGEDGLDEVSAAAPTKVVEVNGEELRTLRRSRPEDVGVAPTAASALAGGDARAERGGDPRDPRRRGATRAARRGARRDQRRRGDLRRGRRRRRSPRASRPRARRSPTGARLQALDALRRGEPPARAERGGAGEHATGTRARPDPRRNARGRRARERAERPLEEPRGRRARSAAGQPRGASTTRCAAPGIGVIAEFKRRSPSAGSLHDAPDLEDDRRRLRARRRRRAPRS